MKRVIVGLCLALASASLLSGCAGDYDANPSRFYLESNRPCSVEQVAQQLPADLIAQETTVKLYAYQDGQRHLVKTEVYPADTVSAAEILQKLPSSGRYWLETELKDSNRTLTYQAELCDSKITLR
ncbi:MAG: hypothetical protein ACI38Q_04505 [Candidatus Bruticola sp.]